MAFTNEPENERTIDYERNAVFKLGGSLGLPPGRMPFHHYYTLKWKDAEVVILSYEHYEVDELNWHAHTNYYISMCEYPAELRPFRDEIINMLKEALTVYGVKYGVAEGWKVDITIKIDNGIGNLNPKFNFETQKFED